MRHPRSLLVTIAFACASLAPTAASAQTDAEATENPAPDAAPASPDTEPGGGDTAPELETVPAPPAVAATASVPPSDLPAEPSAPIVEFRPGSGLTVASPDRQYSLTVDARLQAMALVDFPQGIAAAADGGDPANDPQLGLAIRRAHIMLSGNLFGEDTVYKIELGLSPQDMGFQNGNPTRTPLMDWYVELRQLRDLNFRVGQFKVAYGREFYLSAGRLQMVDLSAVTNEFNLDRDIGVQISSNDLFGLGLLRYRAGVTTGEGRDAGFGSDFGLLYYARVDVLPFGLFDDMTEADLERSPRPRLSIGAAYAFLDNARRIGGITGPTPQDGGTSDYHFFDADALFLYSGFSVMAQFFARSGTRTPGDATDQWGNILPITAPRNGVGWFVQAGYMLPGIDLELSARYGMTTAIGAATETSYQEQGEHGGALSYYVGGGHAYKVQLDFFHLFGDFDQFGAGEQRIRLQLSAQL